MARNRTCARNQEPLSLDMPIGAEDDGSTCLANSFPMRNIAVSNLQKKTAFACNNLSYRLKNRTRRVLEFVFLHELTHKEVAEALDISVVTVSRHLKKGLACLKKVMASPEG